MREFIRYEILALIAAGCLIHRLRSLWKRIGAASGANSIYRRTQFTDFGDKRVGEMCMIVVFFTYLTLLHDVLPVNHAEQHNSSLNQTEI